MSIDPRIIKPGGKVSVTLADGTKIIDSPVGPPNGERHGLKWAVCGLLNVEGVYIASIDAYTPPKPEWDRPEVFAVVDRYSTISTREGSEFRRGPALISSAHLEEQYGPCTVLAIFAHQDSGGMVCTCGFDVKWGNAAERAALQDAIENHESYCEDGL